MRHRAKTCGSRFITERGEISSEQVYELIGRTKQDESGLRWRNKVIGLIDKGVRGRGGKNSGEEMKSNGGGGDGGENDETANLLRPQQRTLW